MNERKAINVLSAGRYRKSFCLPRYTPSKWWECDLFEITAAGYFREYEVKLTRSDFFADTKKAQQVFPRPYGTPVVMENKHELMLMSTRGPVQFWYVTPEGLIKPEELPVWAGLIELRGGTMGECIGGEIRSTAQIFEHEVQPAPRRHNNKLDEAVVKHARGICYWRMHEMLMKAA